MTKAIRLRGVRQNNLKNLDLDIPVNQLTVVTGVSGSGKSSLAFDTLYAEGQRRYIETFSPYARQFFDRMDKPQVDRVEGIPPAIAIEQKNTVKSTRSTVGTMTEICDFMKDLWLHFSRPYCESCNREIRSDTPDSIWKEVLSRSLDGEYLLVVFEVEISDALGIEECLRSIVNQGYQRCLVDGSSLRIEDLKTTYPNRSFKKLAVIQDRVKVGSRSRSRFVEACEQAYKFGRERLQLVGMDKDQATKPLGQFSRRLECASCGEIVPRPSRNSFSFNSPIGACPECRGFGRVIGIDFMRAIPDQSLSLSAGAVKIWQSGHGLRSQRDMMKRAKLEGVSTNVPFNQLSEDAQKWVIYGTPAYGSTKKNRWPNAWYGLKGYFDWLESKSYKMHYRVLLARYRAYYECSACRGSRFKPEVLRFSVSSDPTLDSAHSSQEQTERLHLAGFYRLPIVESLRLVVAWLKAFSFPKSSPLAYSIGEVTSRLQFLVDVGLGYLTLDRPTKTLSGGETERINLTSCLGTRLVNTLFVLDEPSVGLHAVDVINLVSILKRLRDAGNTVVVVEHDAEIIRAADYVVDIGPRSGASGGELVFAGSVKRLLKCRDSATGQHIGGCNTVGAESTVRPLPVAADRLRIKRATRFNLQNLDVEIPLRRFVCLTGVSGSGKTTLVREILVPLLGRRLHGGTLTGDEDNGSDSEGEVSNPSETGSAELSGYKSLDSVVMVDQSPVGKTPRSNPAVYIGVFESIRKLFASARESKSAGHQAGAFSFNSPLGRCERCRGAGFEKIEMQFLSDVFIECPDCAGTRYRREIREFCIDFGQFQDELAGESRPMLSINAFLDMTVDQTVTVLTSCQSGFARKAVNGLRWLQAVGLGYLKLGQPLNTLSGGESQRLKVVRYLAEASGVRMKTSHTLFVFDEPTTGLHFADVKILLKMFRQLIDQGHSLLVVEHHLELIQCADWIIDLGPGAGSDGGQVVYAGPIPGLRKSKRSATGQALNATIGKRAIG